MRKIILLILGIAIFFACENKKKEKSSEPDIKNQYNIAGEVDNNSVILQSRLIKEHKVLYDTIPYGDVPGKEGVGRYILATNKNFQNVIKKSDWFTADSINDYIIKTHITGLEPGKQYFYHLKYGLDKNNTKKGKVSTFKTINPNEKEDISFVMVTGSHYENFYSGREHSDKKVHQKYDGPDKDFGFPAFRSIMNSGASYYIGNGDNVYYDQPNEAHANTRSKMRRKWHQLFSMPGIQKICRKMGTYWLKDDHDYRYNDADTGNDYKYEKFKGKPSHELGVAVFKKQVPVTVPENKDDKTYRTHKMNKHLQLWFVENRDYRSPNKMEDGPKKSIWGDKQKKWLKETLLKSDATYKVLVSPTPMVGPDDHFKIDNHTNLDGFRHERDQFFSWLKENNMLEKNFYIICGDRHWQYHSIHPTGVEEFSCGALVDQNSRLGPDPGDSASTDPKGKIKQPYSQEKPSGGYLKVELNSDNPELAFKFFDEKGELLYEEKK